MTWKKPLEADARLAARNATKVRAALRQSVNTTSLVQAYLLTQPHSSGKISQDRARARAWSILNVRIDTTALEAVLQRIWATGYLLGTLAADQAIAAARTDKSATITKRGEVPSDTPGVGLAVDWDNWEPGDEVSALLIKPPRALQRLLQSQGIVIKDMKATSLNVVGNALGDAIALGLAPKRAAKLIQSQVGSPARALTIAITESNRAVSLATMQRYQDAGLEMSKWLTFDPCPLCAMNANVEVRLNEPFPSGDARPPAHPNCRCALAPVIPDPMLSTSGSTTLVKHLPGRHDQQSHAGGRGGASTIQISGERNWSSKDEANAEAVYSEKYDYDKVGESRPVYDVNFYAGDGYMYINAKLRGRDDWWRGRGLDNTIFTDEQIDRNVARIDEAIAGAPNLVGDKNLYRIMDNEVLDKLNEGDQLIDKGFLSTTRVDITSDKTLRDGLGKISSSADTVAVILPNRKGNGKGLLVDRYVKAQKQPMSGVAEKEKEVLLPRDTPLTFLGYQEKGSERVAIFERAD